MSRFPHIPSQEELDAQEERMKRAMRAQTFWDQVALNAFTFVVIGLLFMLGAAVWMAHP